MTFREMLVEDLDQVVDIEQNLFSVPWTKEGFLTYLMKKDTMFFVVEEKERILGYCSMMTVLDEGDILKVAVRSDRQKEGIGQFLVDSMLRMAEMQGISGFFRNGKRRMLVVRFRAVVYFNLPEPTATLPPLSRCILPAPTSKQAKLL